MIMVLCTAQHNSPPPTRWDPNSLYGKHSTSTASLTACQFILHMHASVNKLTFSRIHHVFFKPPLLFFVPLWNQSSTTSSNVTTTVGHSLTLSESITDPSFIIPWHFLHAFHIVHFSSCVSLCYLYVHLLPPEGEFCEDRDCIWFISLILASKLALSVLLKKLEKMR